ncbi:MAG: hypothetical protein EHM39_08210, partial [Chloroflexi bacterium]
MSIFIGVLGVVTLFSMGNILVNQLKKDIQEDKLAMVKIGLTPSGSDSAASDNAALLDFVQSQPGVTITEGQIISQLYFKNTDSEDFEQGSLIAYSVPMGDLQIEPLQLIEGDFPTAGSAGRRAPGCDRFRTRRSDADPPCAYRSAAAGPGCGDGCFHAGDGRGGRPARAPRCIFRAGKMAASRYRLAPASGNAAAQSGPGFTGGGPRRSRYQPPDAGQLPGGHHRREGGHSAADGTDFARRRDALRRQVGPAIRI